MPVRRRVHNPRLHLYHPEMGGSRDAARLFKSSHVLGKYALEWQANRDSEARAALSAARVRPSSISLDVAGRDYFPRDGRGDRYTAIITPAAHRKLAAFISHEMLLD